MEYDKLSDEAKETIKTMIEFCIMRGSCLGMDEGQTKQGKDKPFQKQQREFINLFSLFVVLK